MKRIAAPKRNAVVAIPLIRRVRLVLVQPQTFLVAFNVEHVRIAIRVRAMCGVPSAPPPLESHVCEFSELYCIRHRYARAHHTK